MSQKSRQIKEILIQLAVDDKLPLDMNELDASVFDKVFQEESRYSKTRLIAWLGDDAQKPEKLVDMIHELIAGSWPAAQMKKDVESYDIEEDEQTEINPYHIPGCPAIDGFGCRCDEYDIFIVGYEDIPDKISIYASKQEAFDKSEEWVAIVAKSAEEAKSLYEERREEYEHDNDYYMKKWGIKTTIQQSEDVPTGEDPDGTVDLGIPGYENEPEDEDFEEPTVGNQII